MATLMLMLLMLQVAADSPASATPPQARAALPVAVQRQGCARAPDGSDIVVCGRRDNEQDRLRPLPEKYREVGGPGIGFRLPGNAQGNVYTTQQQSPDGKPDKRIMLRVKVPF